MRPQYRRSKVRHAATRRSCYICSFAIGSTATQERANAQLTTPEALNTSLAAQLRVCMAVLESKQGDVVICEHRVLEFAIPDEPT